MSSSDELRLIPVPSLVSTLMRAETDKGAPLVEAEVLAIRDACPCIAMPADVAAKLAETRGYEDIDPENAWDEWRAMRPSLFGGGET